MNRTKEVLLHLVKSMETMPEGTVFEDKQVEINWTTLQLLFIENERIKKCYVNSGLLHDFEEREGFVWLTQKGVEWFKTKQVEIVTNIVNSHKEGKFTDDEAHCLFEANFYNVGYYEDGGHPSEEDDNFDEELYVKCMQEVKIEMTTKKYE